MVTKMEWSKLEAERDQWKAKAEAREARDMVMQALEDKELRDAFAKEYVKEAVLDERDEALVALASIIEIGKRDLTNPKYDEYFENARAILAKYKPAPTRAEAEAWLRAGEPVRGALAVPAEHDYSGLCAAPSCEGHCGYVHARGCEAVREYLADHGGKPYRAPSPPDILHRVAERAMWLTAERLGERLNEVEGVRYTMANIDGTAIDTAAIIKEATRG